MTTSSPTTPPAVESAMPVDFSLYNAQEQNVIYTQSINQPMTLEITNTSRDQITLQKKPQIVSSQGAAGIDYHFCLSFRPGTLLNPKNVAFVSISVNGTTIPCSSKYLAGTDKTDEFYVSATDEVTLAPQASFSVQLSGVTADARGGARGTRVELKYKDFLLGADQTPMTGTRMHYLSVMDQVGPGPLLIDWVGPFTALNDGTTPNTLTLRIQNVGTGELDYDDDSKIDLIFPVGSSNDAWAVVSSDKTAGVTVEGVTKSGAATGWQPQPNTQQLVSTQMLIRLQPESPGSLAPGGNIDIQINLVADTPSGIAHLTVVYDGLGNQAGTAVLPLVKSPLFIQGDQVGIGTVTPTNAALEVIGDLTAATHGHLKAGRNGDITLESDLSSNWMRIGSKWGLAFWGNGNVESDDNPQIFIANDNNHGNVGIKTDLPNYDLDVNGNLHATGDIYADGKVGIGTNNPVGGLGVVLTPQSATDRQDLLQLQNLSNNSLLLSAFGSEHPTFPNTIQLGAWGPEQNISIVTDAPDNLQAGKSTNGIYIKSGGNVGIKTTTPGYDLDVNGGIHATGNINADGNLEVSDLNADMIGVGFLTAATIEVSGITIPTRKAPLTVNGATYMYLNEFGYSNYCNFLNNADSGVQTGSYAVDDTTQNQYSIYAAQYIAATEFDAFSDARIKHVRGRSDGSADLRTLLSIEVTDYTYRDTLMKGDRPHKKLIGQQVEEVFPQAVSKTRDVVPDIYQRASCADGWVTLATDLKAGERVRLIADKAEGVYEVLETTPDGFRTDFKPEGDRVFVYGREVEDFRTIDYDAIAMLNVSATQQLKREKDEEVQALRAANAELVAANDALTKRLERLESKLEAAMYLTAKATDGPAAVYGERPDEPPSRRLHDELRQRRESDLR